MNIKQKIFTWLSSGRITFAADGVQINPGMNLSKNNKGNGVSTGQISTGYKTATPDSNPININSRSSALNFTVAKANGGWIVQVNQINMLSSTYPDTDVYLIHEGADFNTEIGKIISMVSLKA